MAIRAGTIIHNPDWCQTLLVLNAHSGLWGFPKGMIEPRETERQAALRETYEETGIKLDPENLGIRWRLNRVVLYHVTVPIETQFQRIDTREIKDIRWFEISDLESIPTTSLVKTYYR